MYSQRRGQMRNKMDQGRRPSVWDSHWGDNHGFRSKTAKLPVQAQTLRRPAQRRGGGAVRCKERLGGLLKYYERRAA